jgi:hypothetical protein
MVAITRPASTRLADLLLSIARLKPPALAKMDARWIPQGRCPLSPMYLGRYLKSDAGDLDDQGR